MLSQTVELSLYSLLMVLQVPTCHHFIYLKNFTLLVSMLQPTFSVWYLTKFHIVRSKPKLYEDFRVKRPPLSAIILTLVANSWPEGKVPHEFLVSGVLAVMFVGVSKECNRHLEHTLHVLATNTALILLIGPSCGLFVFLFLLMCLITIVLFEVRRCFSVSEYVLATTFLSYAVYKAIFDSSSLFVLLCLISIAVYLVLPPQLDRDTILILIALFAWIAVIFSKNMSSHFLRIEHILHDTLANLNNHRILVGNWTICSGLALLFTLFPFPGLNMHVQRKVYHVFVCVVFVSGITTCPQLLSTACAALTFVMFFCEVAYCRGVTFLRVQLQKFKGSQDVEPLVLTPFYLLIGLSIPVWTRFGTFSVEMLTTRASTTFLQSVLPYAGVMTIGVGDACAALIGTGFGRVKLPGTHKTVEGLLGNIAGQALFMVLIGPYLKWGARGANDALILGSVMILSSLLEVYTQDIDNLIIPIYAVLCLAVL